jgi:hypothetical protein
MKNQERFLATANKIAGGVLAGGGILALLALSYSLYFYAWSGARQVTNTTGALLYYGVPAGLALVLFLSLRLKTSYRINFAILFVSLGASIYGTELVLELSDPGPRGRFAMHILRDTDNKKAYAAKLTKQFGVEIDTRDMREVIGDMRKQGIDAVPFVSPTNNLFDKQPDGSYKSALNIQGTEVMPLAGISNKFTVMCNENGYYATYEADEHGFHNPRGIWRSRRFEVAVLGDSFPHGYCVPSDKNFVATIRQRYPALLNLGIAGNGPLANLATFKEYVTQFTPKIVLWFHFVDNDLTDLQRERKSLLSRYLQDGFTQNLRARQNDIDMAMTGEIGRLMTRPKKKSWHAHVKDRLLEYVKLSTLRQKSGLIGGENTDEMKAAADLLSSDNMDVFRNSLLQVKAGVEKWGGEFYFVYLPSWSLYTNVDEQGKKVLALVRTLGIPIIDLYPVFQGHSDPLSLFPFRENGHYNENGHRLVGEEILRTLTREAPGA